MNLKRCNSVVIATTLIISNLFNPGVALASGSVTLYPSANGTYQSWSVNPSYGAHYVALNDYGNCGGYNDYVYSSSTNVYESEYFDVSSIPNGSVIYKMEAIPCAESVSSTTNIQLMYRMKFGGASSTTESDFSTSTAIGTTRQEYATSTKTWTSAEAPVKSASSTLEIGFYIPNSTNQVRVHQMRLILSY